MQSKLEKKNPSLFGTKKSPFRYDVIKKSIPVKKVGKTENDYISKQIPYLPGGLANYEDITTTTSTTTTTTTISIPMSFVSVWRTTTDNESISLPYLNTGTYTGVINWGDGNITNNTYANRTHTYSTAGDYTVTIDGNVNEWSFGIYGDDLNSAKIRSILSWGNRFNLGNLYAYFANCVNLNVNQVTDLLDLSGTTSLEGIFTGCTSLSNVNRIGEWNTSGISNMSYAFLACPLFNKNISAWNTSNVTTMRAMFSGASIFNQNISSWDTTNVLYMIDMFLNATSFNQDLSSWCVPNIPSLPSNFDTGASSWVLSKPIWGTCAGVTTTTTTTSTTTTTTTLPPTNFISTWRTTTPNESITLPYSNSGTYTGTINWGDGTTSDNSYANRTHTYAVSGDYTITVTGTINGFSFGINSNNTNAAKLRSISEWGSSFRLGNVGSYFQGCSNLVLSGVTDVLNLSNTTNLDYMFANCSSLITVGRMNEWDVSNVTTMVRTFNSSYYFNQDISNWNTSNVTSMDSIFNMAYYFNQNISNWNVSNVTNMDFMFGYSNSFNQPIGNWNVSKVTSMLGMFYGTYAFNQPIGNWNTSNVTNMLGMFWYSKLFNQPIGNWNVSKVTDMSYMFSNAEAFNQPIGNWNVSNVTNMSYMFANSTVFNLSLPFNQNISNWNVSNVTNMNSMFEKNISFNQNLSSWCVTNIPSKPTNFDTGASAWTLSKPIWGTCPTTTTTTSTTTTTTTVV